MGTNRHLKRLDKQTVGIARHRARSGGKAGDSQRYRKLVARVRGMLKTRINTALNRIMQIHAPRELVVERLDFRLPGLSRRMNRLVTNCGRAAFRAKLADLHDKFGIAATEVPSPYTSQGMFPVPLRGREEPLVAIEIRLPLVRQREARRRQRAACSVNQRRSLGFGINMAWQGGDPRRVGQSCTPRDFHGRWERPPTLAWTIPISGIGRARGARMLEAQELVPCA